MLAILLHWPEVRTDLVMNHSDYNQHKEIKEILRKDLLSIALCHTRWVVRRLYLLWGWLGRHIMERTEQGNHHYSIYEIPKPFQNRMKILLYFGHTELNCWIGTQGFKVYKLGCVSQQSSWLKIGVRLFYGVKSNCITSVGKGTHYFCKEIHIFCHSCQS